MHSRDVALHLKQNTPVFASQDNMTIIKKTQDPCQIELNGEQAVSGVLGKDFNAQRNLKIRQFGKSSPNPNWVLLIS